MARLQARIPREEVDLGLLDPDPFAGRGVNSGEEIVIVGFIERTIPDDDGTRSESIHPEGVGFIPELAGIERAPDIRPRWGVGRVLGSLGLLAAAIHRSSLSSTTAREVANRSRDRAISFFLRPTRFSIGGSILARNGSMFVPPSRSLTTAS